MLAGRQGSANLLSLPREVKQHLASEFRFAADSITKTEALPLKLYYFSVFFGELSRAFNISWHPVLALMHSVLQDTYRLIQQRITEMQSGADRGIIGLPGEMNEALTKLASDLATLVEQDEIDEAHLMDVLARAAELGYVASGNGHYLYLKGQIKL